MTQPFVLSKSCDAADCAAARESGGEAHATDDIASVVASAVVAQVANLICRYVMLFTLIVLCFRFHVHSGAELKQGAVCLCFPISRYLSVGHPRLRPPVPLAPILTAVGPLGCGPPSGTFHTRSTPAPSQLLRHFMPVFLMPFHPANVDLAGTLARASHVTARSLSALKNHSWLRDYAPSALETSAHF